MQLVICQICVATQAATEFATATTKQQKLPSRTTTKRTTTHTHTHSTMGNKCCSKRQDQELALAYPTGGYKKSDYNFGQTHINSNSGGVGGGVATGLGQKHNNGGSLDSRYTPDPNRGPLKIGAKGGVDIIRTRTTPSKYKGGIASGEGMKMSPHQCCHFIL